MPTSTVSPYVVNPELIPARVDVDDTMLRVQFASGLEVATPVSRFPRLLHASAQQRRNWKLIGRGDGIHWPEIDEDISVRGLFAGARPVLQAGIETLSSLTADLLRVTNSLGEHFRDRHFTLDGVLSASIGHVVAQYIYDLRLEPYGSAFHARTSDHRSVEIRLTGESSSSIALRAANKDREDPNLLICLRLSTEFGFEEIYAGPYPADLVRSKVKTASRQVSVSIKKLRDFPAVRLPKVREFLEANRWLVHAHSHAA